ncbi:hypothetical protein NQZ68_014341 [Dissostichus eleginoides]|nr:hypothetical protein NQZ68_014341 [Dissostichus eleginoides]
MLAWALDMHALLLFHVCLRESDREVVIGSLRRVTLSHCRFRLRSLVVTQWEAYGQSRVPVEIPGID